MIVRNALALALAASSLLFACRGGDDEEDRDTTSGDEDLEEVQRDVRTTFCPPMGAGLAHTDFDTNGDGEPDVVRVFRLIGEGAAQRRVLICREVDLNGDGRHDSTRIYSDEGRPLREQSDHDFDGIADSWDYFEDARIVRVELDTNRDGIVDTKTFYVNGRPSRIERDTLGRSTRSEWRPNRWEYFEDGNLVRIGEDLDGDGRVDRWDRDEQRAEEARRAEAEVAAGASEPEDEDDGSSG